MNGLEPLQRAPSTSTVRLFYAAAAKADVQGHLTEDAVMNLCGLFLRLKKILREIS